MKALLESNGPQMESFTVGPALLPPTFADCASLPLRRYVITSSMADGLGST